LDLVEFRAPLSSTREPHCASGTAPLWLEHGADRAGGGYFDQLDHRNASNACDFKPLRVTRRQIFVFATLDELGLSGPSRRWITAWNFCSAPLRHAGSVFVRSVDLDGRLLDESRDLYDLAFALFALASAYQRSGDSFLADEALALLTFVHEGLAHPQSGFAESLPPLAPTSSESAHASVGGMRLLAAAQRQARLS